MKLFLDTANVKQIDEIYQLGILDGVTTNPSLLSKEDKPYYDVLGEIVRIVDGPVSAEVLSTDFDTMIKEGQQLAAIHPNIVVKLPLTKDGIRATHYFSKHQIKTNVTLCFSVCQALLAAKAGATYVSPFIGRLDDINYNGTQLVDDIMVLLSQYNMDTQVIAASVRNPRHIFEVAMTGAHIATIPYKVAMQMFHHPLTDIGLEKFITDWKQRYPESAVNN